MYRSHTILAVIPARGGSKGLPNKNILECAGKPLIEWTLKAALDSVYVDRVIVSTDSTKIAHIASSFGEAMSLSRPNDLATDDASIVDVLDHAWQSTLNSAGDRYDYVALMQPTSPLRNSGHLNEALKYYFQRRLRESDTLASVHIANNKNGWLMKMSDDGYIKFCFDVRLNNPQRQHLNSFYLPNGAIYILKGSEIKGGLYRENTIPFVMSKKDSIDIDNLEDFMLAEDRLLIQKNNSD